MASLEYKWNDKTCILDITPEKEYYIGRDPECAVSFPDIPKLSRRHSVIFFNTNTHCYCAADINSTNGTFLNGKNIEHQDVPLHDNDKINVGPLQFIFHTDQTAGQEVSTRSTRLRMFNNFSFSKTHQSMKSEKNLFRTGSHFGKYMIHDILYNNDFHTAYLLRDRENERSYRVLWLIKDFPSNLSAGKELNTILNDISADMTGMQKYLSNGVLDSGECYYCTEYYAQPTYAQLISLSSPRSAEKTLPLIYSAALILKDWEKRGWIHGFLTPIQILYAPHIGNPIAGIGLGDWIQKYYHDLPSVHGLWYASPEMLSGKTLTWQSDLYSLGIIFFQMLTGVLPFYSDSPEKLAKMHSEIPLPDPKERNPQVNLPHELSTVLIRMTMKEPSQRYSSWNAFLKDLSKINSHFNKNKADLMDQQ